MVRLESHGRRGPIGRPQTVDGDVGISARVPANPDVRIAREFHDRTTHTPQSIRTSGHMLDWDNKPFPFKIYTELSALALPREVDPLGADTRSEERRVGKEGGSGRSRCGYR